MCGIAGILRFDDRPIDRDRLGNMLAQVQHRGPDSIGLSIADGDPCGLAHARLSIIDLLSGHQPLIVEEDQRENQSDAIASGGGELRLVFNGEIYNHRRLRKKLEKRGHAFHSDHSDTEALLYGYRQWGLTLPKHLHGMFAFAVWDQRERALFLCRDRAGKKPLYFWRSPDQPEVVFGSLVATVVAGMPERHRACIDDDALLNYLRLGYPFEQSMVCGVEEIPAAHWLRIDASGTFKLERYWRAPPISKTSTSLGLRSAMEEVITESVTRRLEADVELGCFLSGGIDSSLIAAIAQKQLAAAGAGPLKTYSVAMPDLNYDEHRFARRVAEHIGASHTVLETRVGDAMSDLRQLMDVTGEPTADSSLLPTHWLCKAARGHVKAALSGDGGDEMFGGYDRYRAVRWLAKSSGRPAALLGKLPTEWLDDARPRGWRSRLARLTRAARQPQHDGRRYHQMIHLFDDPTIAELMPDRFGDALHPRIAPLPGWEDEPDVVHAAMRWDLNHYLPHAILRKVDRASMAVAIEVRCPLLDTAVADLAGHIPPHLLTPGGKPKGLLRDLARDWIPHDIAARPKRGFAVPIGGWFRASLRDELRAILETGPLGSVGVEPAASLRLFDEHLSETRDHTHRLFALLQLSLWLDWLKAPGIPPVRHRTA
ncbi:MAG: asparagine synthase (glutamine-hydrolyzing) [Planctomycetota bacterium]